MELSTAIKILEKEAEFLGLGFLETLEDIQKEGRMVYSEKTMIAFRVFVAEGQKLFAPA
jgi:hypothetical protein